MCIKQEKNARLTSSHIRTNVSILTMTSLIDPNKHNNSCLRREKLIVIDNDCNIRPDNAPVPDAVAVDFMSIEVE